MNVKIDGGRPAERYHTGRTPLSRWNKLVIRVPHTTYSELRSDAIKRGVSLNQLVNELIGEPDQRRDIALAVRRELARVGLVNAENDKTPLKRELTRASAMGGADIQQPGKELNNVEFSIPAE